MQRHYTLLIKKMNNDVNIAISTTNDILKNGVRVTGIVEINGKDLESVCKYNIGNVTFIGGPNQWVK